MIGMDRLADRAYLALPLVLWPISFILLRSIFIYAMTASTLILASLSMYRYRNRIRWNRKGLRKAAVSGICGAVVLYLIFAFGNMVVSRIGLSSFVSDVYASIYSSGSKPVTFILLAVIGISEEIYWRGGLQGYAESSSGRLGRMPWLASTAYYTVVHLSTLNPVLVGAAFFVGITTSLVSYKFGTLASIATHIAWIEAVVIFFPL